MMIDDQTDIGAEQHLIFRLLLGYRWLSLLPPLIALVMSPWPWWEGAALLGMALLTLGLTLAARPVNRWLLRYPGLLGLDLLLSAFLVGATGLEHSPYYLYSLAPILAAAFFFQIRGGIAAALAYALFYLLALGLVRPPGPPLSWPEITGQLISFFLIGAILGYPPILIQRLRQAHADLAGKNEELSTRNRDLNLLQELSLVMQSSVDPAELQEVIGRGLIQEMDYRRALIGLYDGQSDLLTAWITVEYPALTSNGSRSEIAHTLSIPLGQTHGPLVRAMKGNLPLEIMNGEPLTDLDIPLVAGPHYLILPLTLRGQPLGVILLDDLPPGQRLTPAERLSLDHLATHAGVALGSVQLCIDRAQRLAVVEERQRIAADLHDNVSQALYGLSYGLEAAIQLMAREPELQAVLSNLYTSVSEAQGELRKTIFETRPAQITAGTFSGGLHRYLRTISPVRTLDLRIDLPADFDHWAELTRRQLYRITQEALANTVKHAHARQMSIKLGRAGQQIELRLADDGDGFDPAKIDHTHHLGLQNMLERVESLAGNMEINSAYGEGTLIIVNVPYVPAISKLTSPLADPPKEKLCQQSVS